MKTEYLILEEDAIAEKAYSDGGKIEMSHSKSEIWSSDYQGKKIGHLKDNGQGIKINIEGKKIQLDYDEYCYLRNLMVIKDIEDGQICATTEIIKKVNQ